MQSVKKSKTILVTSTKGGVGKTIFTLNMAGVFAALEKKVLIIDMDLMSGSIALSLNKPYNKSIYDLEEDIKNNVFEDFDNYTLKYNEYISVVAAPKDPRDASKIDIRFLDTVLDQAAFKYDIILLDSSDNLDPINLFLLEKVDDTLFMVTNDPFCLKSTRSLIAILNNIEIKNYHIILNNSTNPYKNYFSLYDIKNILQANVDYTISNSFFIENIDKLIMAGEIITLNPSIARTFNKDYSVMMMIAADLTKGSDNNGKK